MRWPPAPIFLAGKVYRQRSLVGYSPWDYKEQEATEHTHTHTHTHTHKSIWRELTYFPIHDHNMPLHLFTSSGFLFLLIFSFHHVPCSSFNKESACSAEDLSSIPGLGRSPGEGNGNPLQYPCLENLMNRGAWQAAVRGVAKSRARLSIYHLLIRFTLRFFSCHL